MPARAMVSTQSAHRTTLPPGTPEPGPGPMTAPVRMGKDGGGNHQGGVVRLTIDTETDSYEQAIAAVQAAYGLRPVVPDTWPPAPAQPRAPTHWISTATSDTAGPTSCCSAWSRR